MTALTASSSKNALVGGMKMKTYLLPTTSNPSDTLDVSADFATIYDVHIVKESGAAVASGTWNSSTRVVTLPATMADNTVQTYLTVWGI